MRIVTTVSNCKRQENEANISELGWVSYLFIRPIYQHFMIHMTFILIGLVSAPILECFDDPISMLDLLEAMSACPEFEVKVWVVEYLPPPLYTHELA